MDTELAHAVIIVCERKQIDAAMIEHHYSAEQLKTAIRYVRNHVRCLSV